MRLLRIHSRYDFCQWKCRKTQRRRFQHAKRRDPDFCPSPFSLDLVCVAFSAGRFQIENEILHVETKLRDRFLDQGKNLSSPMRSKNQSLHERLKFFLIFQRQLTQFSEQSLYVLRQMFPRYGCFFFGGVKSFHISWRTGIVWNEKFVYNAKTA